MSEFNFRLFKLREQLKDGEMGQVEFDQKVLSLIRSYDVNIVNARLTDEGNEQCIIAQKEIYKRYPQIKRVILSPFRRVIQTFETTFEKYPNFVSKDLKVSFMDLLRERLCSNADVACWTQQEKESLRFPELYDWSFLDNFQDKKFWFLENGSKQMYEKAARLFENAGKDDESKLKALIDDLVQHWEDSKSIYDRSQKSKESIRQIIKEENLNDDEVIVICHHDLLKYFTWTKVNDNYDPMDGDWHNFENTECLSYELDL